MKAANKFVSAMLAATLILFFLNALLANAEGAIASGLLWAFFLIIHLIIRE
jgi:hypothetical protein